MDLRPLDPDHLDAALVLWASADHLGPVPRAEVERLQCHDGGLVLAAEDDGELVGVVLAGDDGRRGWISRLAVRDAHRRRGIGRALVAEAERWLTGRGCPQVNLLVLGDNDGGRAFWEAAGYEGYDEVVLYTRRLDGDGPGSC